MNFGKTIAVMMMLGVLACLLVTFIRIGLAILSYECWSRELLKQLKTRHSKIYDELAPLGPFNSGSIRAIYKFAQSDRLQHIDEVQVSKELVAESVGKLMRLAKLYGLLLLVSAFVVLIIKLAGQG